MLLSAKPSHEKQQHVAERLEKNDLSYLQELVSEGQTSLGLNRVWGVHEVLTHQSGMGSGKL